MRVQLGYFISRGFLYPLTSPPPPNTAQNYSYITSYCVNSNMKSHHVTWCSFAAAPYVMHALCVVSFALSFSIVPWTLFRPWTLYRPQTPWRMHLRKLHHLTWRSFAAVPYVMHALRVASSARSFSIVLWTLFRPWTLFQLWTLWSTHSRKLNNIYQNTYIVLHTCIKHTHCIQ